MTTPERMEIVSAMQRLLKGCPLRSSGELTVVQLAAEADVKRWRLTHKHTDLMHEFQAAVRAANGVSEVEVRLQDRVGDLEADLNAARAENADLLAKLATYAQVIDDLSTALDLAVSQPAPVRHIRPQGRMLP